MIAVDTSAIVAIIKQEKEEKLFKDVLEKEKSGYMSAATFSELGIVMSRRTNPTNPSDLSALLNSLYIEITPLNIQQSILAIEAYQTYGKGTGHKAGLNYGDCFSYALAKSMKAPLLFKGEDFIHTDIANAAKIFAQ